MSISLSRVVLIGEELALAFADGTEIYLPLSLLRRACPCAACQGEPDALGRVARPRVELGPEAHILTGWEPVGGYALQLAWADGHATGIYSFDYLRRLASLPE